MFALQLQTWTDNKWSFSLQGDNRSNKLLKPLIKKKKKKKEKEKEKRVDK